MLHDLFVRAVISNGACSGRLFDGYSVVARNVFVLGTIAITLLNLNVVWMYDVTCLWPVSVMRIAKLTV